VKAGFGTGEPFAPPKVSCGADPPGPNFPSPAGGEAASIFDEGENDLLCGVVFCSGPDGAKENREVVFFGSGVLLGTGLGKVKGFDAGALSSSSVISAMTSSMSSLISAEGFFGAPATIVADSVGVAAPKLPKETGELAEDEDLAGSVGTKPPVLGVEEGAAFG